MKHAYNPENLKNLLLLNEVRVWQKSGIISKEQSECIETEYKSNLYCPNVFIKILLFLASYIALHGFLGFFWVILMDFNDKALSALSIIAGLGLVIFLEKVLIKNANHYKSGVNELFIYSAILCFGVGICNIYDFNYIALNFIIFGLLASFAAMRYLDLITTIGALFCLGGLLFYTLFELGGVFKALIPIVFFVVFGTIYFGVLLLKKRPQLLFWKYNILVLEIVSLLVVYFSANYLVVRELSIELMNIELKKGQDIPLAWVFYILTVLIPLVYLYFGLKNRNIVLLRISLLAVAFSVFTFKYYYSLGHPEITLTLAGALMLGIGIYLNRYLKTIKYGFTREKLLSSKWHDLNAETILISQTLGGSTAPKDTPFEGDGGEFGGGGASGSF